MIYKEMFYVQRLLIVFVYFIYRIIFIFVERIVDYIEDVEFEVYDEVGVYFGYVEVEEVLFDYDVDVGVLVLLAGEDVGQDVVDVAEIDVFGVIMVVEERVYEGEIGFVVEIFDYGMGVYCEVYEWVL